MEKEEKALELLRKKVLEYDFGDDMYTLVHEIINKKISEVENEIGEIESYGDIEWYDDERDELEEELYVLIARWLRNK